MGDISRALGTPSTLTYKGREYKVSPWNYGILGEFEVYLQDQAMRTLKRMKRYLTDKEFADLASQTRKDIDVGVYSFGSEEVRKALDSRVHFPYLLLLCLRENQPEVTYETCLEMVTELGEEVLNKMNEANSDPKNSQTPSQS